MKSMNSYMRKNKLSYTQMAAKLGLSYRCVYNWSRGNAKPLVDAAIRLEKLTNGAVSVYSWA